MNAKRKRAAAVLAALLVVLFVCMFAADGIQRGGGSIAVTEGWIETDVGDLMYKLYTPQRAPRRRTRPPACCFCTAIRTTMRPARPTP